MTPDFTIGDLIQKLRKQRHWNQERLGLEAARFKIRGDEGPINKNTVSSVERNPYSSDFATICRLVAALGMSLCEAEKKTGSAVREEERPRKTRERAG